MTIADARSASKHFGRHKRFHADRNKRTPGKDKFETEYLLLAFKIAPMTGNHPFMNGCGEIPKDVGEKIASVQTWLKTQAHLPRLTDEHVYMFLHSNYYDVELTHNTINTYFAVRSASPELFLNRSPADAEVQAVWDMLYMVPLPKTTPEGYKVLIYKLKETDPSKFNHAHCAKAMILYSDIRMAEDGLCPGYVIIGDPRGFSASHLTRINLSILRTFMKYMQEAKPVRLKGLHIIHSAKIIEKLVAIARPFMKSELTKVLQIHSGADLTNLYRYVSRDILPEDYGGKGESLGVLHERNRQMMTSKYVNWIKEEDAYVAEAAQLNAQNGKNKSPVIEEAKFRNLNID